MKDNKTINSVDCIFDINGKEVILIQRGHEPFKGYWALPGGRQRINEGPDEAVIREINEETGLETRILYDSSLPRNIQILGQQVCLEQIRTYGPGKDPRGGNTTVYAVKLRFNPNILEKYLKKGDDAKDIGIFEVPKFPKLAFDHYNFLEDYYCRLKKNINPIPTTDIIIEYDDGNKEGIVLIERKNYPYGIAIPGGFAEKGLTLEENAVKEAKEETNLDIIIQNPHKPLVFSDPNRDPRKHTISNTYIAKGFGKLMARDDALSARVYALPEIKELIKKEKFQFDHGKILEEYLKFKGG